MYFVYEILTFFPQLSSQWEKFINHMYECFIRTIFFQDTMTGVRALIYHDRDRTKFDVEVSVQTVDTKRTLIFNETDSHGVQRVDLPVLPVSVNLSMTGSGCALFKVRIRKVTL